eukprot:jgi/Undpi1/6097/HiC_scaffold_20.g08582.m1
MAIRKKDSNSEHHAGSLHLVTPTAALEALREPTAGVDLMDRHNLNRYEGESRRTLRRGISHFLSPLLQALIKEKPRIALAEKAEFAELLSEELSGRPIQELSIDLLRRSFMIRRRVASDSSPDDDDEAPGSGRPPVPPDVPFAEQTTNKASPAYARKNAKRARSPDVEDTLPPPPDIKAIVKPLISKLIAMKWPGWSNPFSIVLKRSNAPPRYFEVVKRHMNLIYIRDNINKNRYSTVSEVEADLELIVNNATTFNRPNDPVYQFALELQTVFRSELSLIRRTGGGGQGGREDGQIDKRPRVR